MTSPEKAPYSSTKIAHIRRLSPEVLCVGLYVPPGFSWKPGQHVGVTDRADGKLSYYSIATAQDDAGRALVELAMHEPSIKWPGSPKLGDELFMSVPGGGPDLSLLLAARAVNLIGMGTGVSPLRAVTQALLTIDSSALAPITLLHGARDRLNCIFYDELAGMQNERFRYAPVLSRLEPQDDWPGRTGRVQGHLDELSLEGAFFCICGKLPMVFEVAHLLRGRGVSEEQIFSEGY